jgi:hypothetical protein
LVNRVFELHHQNIYQFDVWVQAPVVHPKMILPAAVFFRARNYKASENSSGEKP